jgi:hypothetical protein
MNIYIIPNSLIAKLAAAYLKERRVAVTIGNKIYLHNCSREEFLKNKKWVCHELVHTFQYKRLGGFRFMIEYLFEMLTKGYHKNKFEIEAHAMEHDTSLLDGIKFR